MEAHDQALRFGGLDGVRSLALIESAIARPYSGYYRTISKKAAALTQSLAKNHGFIDGNKRTTFAALYTFLAINGARITADAEETFEFADALYEANQFRFEKIVCWLRHAVAQSPRISDAE